MINKIKIMYPAEIVLPMKKELVDAGFEDLSTPEEVDFALETKNGVLVVINSVCGCAAGNARPAAKIASEHPKAPKLVTVFAGFDKEAVEQVRKYRNEWKYKTPIKKSANYTKPYLRQKLFLQIKAAKTHGTKSGQWSARKAQLLAKKYKQMGGDYY